MALVRKETKREVHDVPDLLHDEAKNFTLSLMNDKEKFEYQKKIEKDGYMKLSSLMQLLEHDQKFNIDGKLTIDPELVFVMDRHFDEKVFIVEDRIYTRDQLYSAFPLTEFAVIPEALFEQQRVAEFSSTDEFGRPETKYETCRAAPYDNDFPEGELCTEPMLVPELVAMVTSSRRFANAKRTPVKRVVESKIYIANDEWSQFIEMYNFLKMFNTMNKAQKTTETLLLTAPPEVRLALTGTTEPKNPMRQYIQNVIATSPMLALK